jgi:hypothetical protein
MKRLSNRCLTLVSVSIALLFSCNKTHYTPALANALFQSDVEAQAQDQIRIPTEMDALFNDINTILLYQDSVINDTETITSHFPGICGLYAVTKNYVDTTTDLITVQYDGITCDGTRARLGTIYIYQKPGSSWSTAGDTIGVNFANFKTLWLVDNDSVTVNGTFYIVDSSGGSLANFNAATKPQPIVQDIIGVNASVLFETQITSIWQVWRRRAFTYNAGMVITTTGIDTASGLQGVSEVGGNRFGNGFITTITTPLVVSQACNYRITSGQEQVVNPAGTTVLTLGVDSLGNATGCPVSGGNYYFQASWTGTGEAPYIAQFPYYPYTYY